MESHVLKLNELGFIDNFLFLVIQLLYLLTLNKITISPFHLIGLVKITLLNQTLTPNKRSYCI
jgi:hypothetical protein